MLVLLKARKFFRHVRRAAIVLLVLLAALYLWLARDRTAVLLERRGALDAVVVGPEVPRGAYRDQVVRLTSTSGLEAEMLVRRPAVDHEPAPLVVLLGGLRTGRDAARLVEADRPVVVAALDYPTELEKIRTNLGLFADVAEARRALLDTPGAVMLALDHLLAEPFVDPTRVELVGVSLGAPFACIVGAQDPRVGRVWSIHGGGEPARLIAKGLEDDIPFGPARWAVSRIAAGLALSSTLAPEEWVGDIAPRPFVMVNAKDDDRIPKACVDVLFDAAEDPRELIWDDGGHIDQDREAALRRLTDLVLSRL